MVNLNRQANLADDLGYRDGEGDDQGAGLVLSILTERPVVPVADVRRASTSCRAAPASRTWSR